MKYNFSFLLFLGLVFLSHATESNLIQNKQIDSIQYYFNLANNPKDETSLPKAFDFFNKRKQESIRNNDSIATIKYLRQQAIIQYELGDYYGSESTAVEALQHLKGYPDNDFAIFSKIGLYNQLGRTYMELMDYDAALYQFNKGLKLAEAGEYINIIKNNIALVHIERGDYELAEKEFLEVYQKSKRTSDKKQEARALDNLGFVESKLNRPNALEHLKKALQLRLEINDRHGIYSSYKYLSQYYKEKNQMSLANDNAELAYETAKSLGSSSYLEDALKNKMTIEGNESVQEFLKVNDSLKRVNQLRENKYALIKFNYAEQERLANDYKFKQEKEKSQKIAYQFIGAFLVLIFIFIYFYLRFQHKKEKLQQVYNTEKRISKKIHDEVANDVYQVMSKYQNIQPVEDELLDDLELIYNKTRDISKENKSINFMKDFSIVLTDLLQNYNDENIRVIAKNLKSVSWSSISELKKTALYRVLQELMTNAKKHSQASFVIISFEKMNQRIAINYSDNGIGCILKKQNGLRNTENRIQAVNGTITFDSEPGKGFKAKITL
ncbi:ATP-binding protein [Tamlana flava]|uniref:ATP-binding protein n=1 Tax=Tamlana flava TaxID=3158572 RepID=UPI00351AC56F